MEQSSSCEADNPLAGQEIALLVHIQKFSLSYSQHLASGLDAETEQIHTHALCFFKININIILPLTNRSPKTFFPVMFSD
jgi:hypothetical protein